jgi:iron complex transport system ATP-binding protein
MIRIKNLTIQAFPSRTIMTDINVNFTQGALHAIIGPNGGGKTTLLRSIAGLIPLTGKSSIHIDDKNLSSLNNFERAKLLSYVESQHIAPFSYTVEDVVQWGRWAKHKGQPTSADHDTTFRSASLIGIDKMLDRPFNELSTGERKKTLIAQSLASQSKYYIWDEPLAPLDLKAASDVVKIAKELAMQGSTLLISFHDISLALRHADTVTVIDNGRIAWTGKSQDPGIVKHVETTFGVKSHHGGIYFI